MIACKQCQTTNGLDSKFCKNCGQPLADDAITTATVKHEQMVREGYSLFNAGLTGQALLIAQAAVEENANSANALSLLGMCYERLGQLAEALECFERVLTIMPDSALERMKVSQLRNSLTTHIKTDSKLNKRFALISGLSALAIITFAGLAIALGGKNKPVAANVIAPSTTTPTIEAKPFNVAEQQPQTMVVAQQTPQNPMVPNPQPLREPLRTQPTDNQSRNDSSQDYASNRSDGEIDNPIRPVNPSLLQQAPTVIIPSADQAKPGNSGDPAPSVDTGTKTTPATEAKNDPPKDDPGVIEITVSKPRNQESAGGNDSSPNQLQALMKTARNEFLIGKYDSAARSYERALQHGGDQGTINQRLGMCYEKLGRTSDAVAAYTRAASAFEYAINSGQGDSKRLKSGLDSCKQAIKLLKG
ncbi:MAG TPA: tetratricopeptide repeat protein [Fimbriimonadaceae bacterium]|jgi:tetratricopeptide (TPR) repeat protein